MKNFLIKYKKIILIGLILCIALFLRIYKLPERTIFNADQEWLAFRAKEILLGDLHLLGPVTSVGQFSIGPGFIFLWSLVSFFMGGAPIAGAYLSIFLGLLFIFSLYLFCKYFIEEKVSLPFLFLLATSSTLIFWDQVPWAPSLFYLSQTILLAGAYLANKNSIGYPIMSLGVVLGFQSHIGVILSILSLGVYFIFSRPVIPNIKLLFLSFLILLLGILPTMVFDVTHDYVNLQRLASIRNGDGIEYFVSFGKIIDTLSYSTASIIYPRKINLVDSIVMKSIFALVIISGVRLLSNVKYKNLSLLLLITAIVPALFFYLQQGKFSEYYLMMTVPSLLLLTAFSLRPISNNKPIFLAIMIIAVSLNFKEISKNKVAFNLKAKQDISEEIIKLGGKENYSISMSVQHGEQFGFSYIFEYLGIKADIPPKKDETKIFTIVIPEGFEGVNGLKDFDGIGLIWQGI